MKDKLTADYRVKDIYKDLTTDVPYITFSAFIQEANDSLLKEVIYNNMQIKLPGMGHIEIRKRRPRILDKAGNIKKRALKIDYKATKDLWKELYPDKSKEEIKELRDKPVVYHTNKHSDGYIYKFVWDKLTCNMPFKSFYRFKAARGYTRLLAKELKKENCKLDFYEIRK
jgi:hypothetical protein